MVVLHHYLDLPLSEVAETLGVPEGTVRSRLHHAMRGLRAALDADARPTSAGGCAVSTDRDVTRIVRSWMDEGVTQLPDRVLDLVLDQLPATPQRRPWWLARRTPTMNNYARLGLVAAAVLAVVIVGIGLFGRSPDVGPTTSPSPLTQRATRSLGPGRPLR